MENLSTDVFPEVSNMANTLNKSMLLKHITINILLLRTYIHNVCAAKNILAFYSRSALFIS